MSETTSQLALLIISGIVVVALGTYSALTYIEYQEELATNKNTGVIVKAHDPFQNVVLEARAAYVWDIVRGEKLFAHNDEAQLPLASITKLMTALVAARVLEGTYTVTIDHAALAQDGDSGFVSNERFRVQDLLDFTLLESSNDGAFALAAASGALIQTSETLSPDERFVMRMNYTAEQLGLTQTYFVNPTGLDTTEQVSGGYGSARDVALLMTHLLQSAPAVIEATRYPTLMVPSLTNGLFEAENTNAALGDIPGFIASKTGFTDLAGGNLVIAFDTGLNHPVVAVVLGSTEEGRFRDIKKLVAASRESVRTTSLEKQTSAVE